MKRDEILIELYRGRTIIKEEFSKYFEPNGEDPWYVCYVESGEFSEFELHAHVLGDVLDYVEPFKPEVYGGHGRPTVIEHDLTSSEKKTAYEILDRCFRDQAADEVDAVIDNAIEKQAEYEGYKLIKRVSGGIQYLSPDGKKRKLQAKRVLQALDYSHIDISFLHDAEKVSAFMSALGRTPFQPLFALLQTVNAKKKRK